MGMSSSFVAGDVLFINEGCSFWSSDEIGEENGVDTKWIKNTGVKPDTPEGAAIDIKLHDGFYHMKVFFNVQQVDLIDWSIDGIKGDVIEWRLALINELTGESYEII
jgi:hypothetical protein